MILRIASIALHVVIGLAAIGAGQALALQPGGEALSFDVAWLRGSPFPDYRFPGLFLAIVVGGANLASAVALARGWDFRSPSASWRRLWRFISRRYTPEAVWRKAGAVARAMAPRAVGCVRQLRRDRMTCLIAIRSHRWNGCHQTALTSRWRTASACASPVAAIARCCFTSAPSGASTTLATYRS